MFSGAHSPLPGPWGPLGPHLPPPWTPAPSTCVRLQPLQLLPLPLAPLKPEEFHPGGRGQPASRGLAVWGAGRSPLRPHETTSQVPPQEGGAPASLLSGPGTLHPQPRPRAATLVPEGRDSHGVGWCPRLLPRGPDTNSLTPAGRPVIRFNSDTDSPEPGRTPQVKGKVLRKTTPLQMPAAELGAARTSDRPTDHKRGVSRTPPGVTTRRSRSGNSP